MPTAANSNSVSIATAAVPHKGRAVGLFTAWSPYLIALFFALSALRGVSSTDVVDTDAARHAMNGAFIYDMARGGHLLHPVEYAKEYYAHLPALSMPYHPPGFPAIEALFFAVFGVSLLPARLAVAVSVGACAILLYKLVEATLGSRVLAACVTVTTLSLWTCQLVARDVMLEYPAMGFSLAALYCVRDLDHYTMRRAVLFGVLAAAAVWTKQHAVFLGAVPLIQAVLTRRWRIFTKAPIWISSAIFGAAVLGLTFLSRLFQATSVDQMMSSSARDVFYILTWVLPTYSSWIAGNLKGLPGVFAAGAIAGFCVWTRKPTGRAPELTLYVVWAIAIGGVLTLLGAVNERYLFFALPAAVTIGYGWLARGCSRLWGERSAVFIAAAFAVAFFAVGLFVPVEFMRGPGASAQVVAQGSPARVLYAGEADGNFIFAVRSRDPQLQMTVVLGGKLPPETFEPEKLDAFCRQVGIDWVILENGSTQHPWSRLRDAGLPSLKLERTIPLESNRSRWATGTIDVYRFTGSKGPGGGVLDLPVRKLGGSIGLKL